MPSQIKVTVICPTYNHEKYIEKTLLGFVRQKTNFDFIVLVGEDASTDGTADIVRRYAQLAPKIIKPFFREKNLGLGLGGNSHDLHIRIDSPYFTICEGDDHWVNDSFLQKGMDCLEANPQAMMFMGNTIWRDAEKQQETMTVKNRASGWVANLENSFYAHTSARLYRHVHHYPLGDTAILHYYLHLGPAYYLDEVISTYNYNCAGIWSGLSAAAQRRDNLAFYYTMNKVLNYEHDRFYGWRLIPYRNQRLRRLLYRVRKLLGPERFWKLYRLIMRHPGDFALRWVDEY